MEKIRLEKYNGQYSAAGLIIILNTISGIGALAMVCVIIIAIYILITNPDQLIKNR